MRNSLGSVQSTLVLGGGSEIADRVVRKLIADRCDRVILAVRDPAAVEAQMEAYRRLGAADVAAVAFDARATSDHGDFIAKCFADGDLDLVISAFGVLGDQAAFDDDPAAAAESVEVNLAGHVSTLLASAREMKRQGHGTLMVFSSVAGVRPRADNAVYGATKAGLDGFSAALGDRLHGSGVRVVTVRPGFVHTKMTQGLDPAPFATTPEKVADDVIDGLARGTDVIWSPRILRYVFGVLRFAPRPLWRKLSG